MGWRGRVKGNWLTQVHLEEWPSMNERSLAWTPIGPRGST